jgi:hypothetical protein
MAILLLYYDKVKKNDKISKFFWGEGVDNLSPKREDAK